MEAERIVLAASTSEGYAWAFKLCCDPDDEVLVPAPSYPLFEYLASIQDVTLVRYPLFYDHGWHVDMHALEQVRAEAEAEVESALKEVLAERMPAAADVEKHTYAPSEVDAVYPDDYTGLPQ